MDRCVYLCIYNIHMCYVMYLHVYVYVSFQRRNWSQWLQLVTTQLFKESLELEVCMCIIRSFESHCNHCHFTAMMVTAMMFAATTVLQFLREVSHESFAFTSSTLNFRRSRTKASLSHLQFSASGVSLARKLHFHNFNSF